MRSLISHMAFNGPESHDALPTTELAPPMGHAVAAVLRLRCRHHIRVASPPIWILSMPTGLAAIFLLVSQCGRVRCWLLRPAARTKEEEACQAYHSMIVWAHTGFVE